MTEKSPKVSTRTTAAASAKTATTAQEKRLEKIKRFGNYFPNKVFAQKLVAEGRFPADAQDVLVSVLNQLDGNIDGERDVLMSALSRNEQLAPIMKDEPRSQLIAQLVAASDEVAKQDERLSRAKNLLMALKYAAREEESLPELRSTLFWPDLIEAIEQTLPTFNSLEFDIRKAVSQVQIRPTVVQASTPQSEPTRRREAVSALEIQPA